MKNQSIKMASFKGAQPFDCALLEQDLKEHFFGRSVICKDTLDSTNVFLKGLAQKGAVEGTVVIADEQSAGLGRLGRQWFSPKGENLLFSVLLRPKLAPGKIFTLTMIFALAGIDAVAETCGLNAMIKWPNDIYMGRKKLGGILTEFSVLEGIVQYVVLGMGLNVNWNPEHEPDLLYETTSIQREVKNRVSREQILHKLLHKLEWNYTRVNGDVNEREELFKRWNRKSLVIGKRVVVENRNERILGQVTGIDRDGALLLMTNGGEQRKIVSGDVSVKIDSRQ